MKLTVATYKGGDRLIASVSVTSERAARKKAKRAVEAGGKGAQVYVEWYRASDGQKGYYNPDGNHSPVGRAW